MSADRNPMQIDGEVNIDKINNNIDSSDLKGFKQEFDKTMSKAMSAFKISPDAKTFDTSGIQKIASKFYKVMYGAFKIDDKNIITDDDIKNMVSRVRSGLKEALTVQPSQVNKDMDRVAKDIETKVGSAMRKGLQVDKKFDGAELKQLESNLNNAMKEAANDGAVKLSASLGVVGEKVRQLRSEYAQLQKIQQSPGPEHYEEQAANYWSQARQESDAELQALQGILDIKEKIKAQEDNIKQITKQATDEEIRYSKAVQAIELSRKSDGAKESAIQRETEAHNKKMGQIKDELASEKEILHTQNQQLIKLQGEEYAHRKNGEALAQQAKNAEKNLEVSREERNSLEERTEKLNEEAQLRQKEYELLLSELNAEKNMTEEEKRRKEIEAEIRQKQGQLQAKREEAAEIRRGTAQYYYRLRAIKMLDHVIRQADASINKFVKDSIKGVGKTTKLWFKLATPFGLISEAIKKATDSLKTFNRESKRTTKSHDGFIDSMKHGIWTVIKYTFGIRSLYFLFRKLRSALSDGMKNLATQYDHVNQQMSSVVSSIERMKNAIAAMVQPLLNVLAPALEKISELFANLAYNIGSFFAALTGQDFVYYAKKIKKGYIEDKKAAKDYNDEVDRQLSNLDKLNVLTSPKDKKKDEEESPVADMFDVRKISPKALGWLQKLKDFFKPIIDAWNKMKDYVISSWKYAWGQLVALAKDIWGDFLRVWFEPKTQRIFEDIFQIVGDIGLIVGNLAKNFRKAWDHNDNGYRILKAIRDIIFEIVDGIRKAADYTVKWSEELSFIPLMDAIANVMEKQIVPAVHKIVTLLVVLYEDVILELVRYVVEDLGPILVKIFGNIAETVGNIADNFREAWQELGLGDKIVQDIEDIITDVATVIEDVSEKTKEWAANLNFRPLLRETHRFLVRIRPLIKKIAEILGKFWTDVLLPIGKDFIENYLPEMLKTLGDIIEKIDLDQLSATMDSLFGLIRTFWDKYGDVMLSVITQIADKLVELINSGTLEQAFQKATDFIGSLDPDKVADFVIKIGELIAGVKLFTFFAGKLTGSLTGLWTVINFIKQSDMTRRLGEIASYTKNIKGEINLLKSSISGVSGSTAVAEGAVKSFAEMTQEELDDVCQDALYLANHFDDIGENAVKASGKAGGAMSTLSTALASPAATAVVVVASIAAIIAVVVTLWKTNEEFRDNIKGIWDSIKETFSDASEKIVADLNSIGIPIKDLQDGLSKLWLFICNSVAPLFTSIAQSIGNAIKGVINEVSGAFQILIAIFHGFIGIIKVAWGAIKSFSGDTTMLKEGWDDLKNSLNQGLTGLGDLTKGMYQIGSATPSDEFKELSNVMLSSDAAMDGMIDKYGDTTEKQNELSDSSQNLSQNMDVAASSTDALSSSLANMPSSMSPELAASITEMKSQLEEAGVSVEELDGNLENVNTEAFTNAVGTQIPAATAEAKTSMTELQTAATETSTTLSQEGKNASDGFSTGVTTGLDALISVLPGKFGLIVRIARQIFDSHSPSRVFDSIGRDVIQGLANGIKSMINVAISAMRGVANSVISTARSALSASKLVTIGRNLLSGLANGIRSGVSTAVNAIGGAANSVIEAAKRRFQTHSPSKIFEDIGKMLDEGLAVGVDKNTDDVTDAFDNMVPDNQFLELFYEKFTGMLSSLREESVSIVESMIDEIESAIARMDNLAMLESLSTQLSNISSIKIPDIAVGAKVPDNEKFAQTQTVDLSSLPKMLKSAFIEAFAETSSLQTSDSGDIIIEMNGHELLRAVRDENTKYKKQTGRSAFA